MAWDSEDDCWAQSEPLLVDGAVQEAGEVQVRVGFPRRTGRVRLSFSLQDTAREVDVPVSVRVGNTGPTTVEERGSNAAGVAGNPSVEPIRRVLMEEEVRVTVGGAVMTGRLAFTPLSEKSASRTISSRLDQDSILVEGGVMVTGLGIVALAVEAEDWPAAML